MYSFPSCTYITPETLKQNVATNKYEDLTFSSEPDCTSGLYKNVQRPYECRTIKQILDTFFKEEEQG